MAINEESAKFFRCQQAVLDHLAQVQPNYLGHRKIAIILLDPHRGTGKGEARETYCDEMTRKAINALEKQHKVKSKVNFYAGLKMKVFAWAEPV